MRSVPPGQWGDRETDCGVRNAPHLWSAAEDSMKPVLFQSHALSAVTSNNHQVNIDWINNAFYGSDNPQIVLGFPSQENEHNIGHILLDTL